MAKMRKYIPKEIEPKLQEKWKEEQTFRFNPSFVPKAGTTAGKYYTLVELPYTSGDLHVGHWFNWATPDAYSRFKKMSGFNVFFPHGYDAIGLPAENAAIKRGIHPRDWTLQNIEKMQAQFKTIGSMMKLDDPVISCSDDYFKWNQWIFIKMYEKGIAYKGKTLSNWCPVDKTVLADEHVEGGKCWRCGAQVEKKEVEQWFLRITKYADELVWTDKATVDWPNAVKVGQNNWIGKKEGINMEYPVKDSKEVITCFTTAPVNFGMTFIVIAPEHPLVKKIMKGEIKVETKNKKEVEEYVKQTEKKSEMDRLSEGKIKTGVFTGLYATNRIAGWDVPVWVSDFVIGHVGTGAVQGCPGHDYKDFEFAKKFNLPIIRVVAGEDGDTSPIEREKQIIVKGMKGKMVNSKFLNGLDFAKGLEKTMDFAEEKGWGKRVVTYHIRDWSVSRQRYWGTPVPMIDCKKCGTVPVSEKDLPVLLPYDVDYTPKGKAPLASNEKWLNVKCSKCAGPATRDPETLDTFFDSAWYYYRYISPHYDKAPFDMELARKLMPVDIYFGGAEHTLGHTLYARFFTKFFKDLGLIDFEEFALKRIQHGIVLGTDGNKMSKSKGNVINPDDVVKDYGADAVRLYLCFMMPYESTGPWSTTAIEGVYRFVNRVWYLFEKVDKEAKPDKKDLFMMHKTIKKVGRDILQIKMNTAIAAIMEWLNHISRKEKVSGEEYRTLLLLLSPFAPHMTDELWTSELGEKESIHLSSWPKAEEKYLTEDEVSIPVQVNGKVRGVITLSSSDLSKETVVKKATSDEKVKKYIEKKEYKVVYVQGKILNLIVR